MMPRQAALKALAEYEEKKAAKLAESFKVGAHQQ